MIISTNLLKNAIEKYSKGKRKREGYSSIESINAGISASFDSAFLIIAIIFFTLEVLVMFYCVVIALNCSQPGPERVIHVVLAVTFTLPYALLMLLFNKCAPGVLANI
jgi:NADH:ubiquinone oxidoreductase subunit 3 (subunit A)